MSKPNESIQTDSSPWWAPMRSRSPEEAHRPATPLELFFDLVFVVAIAQASEALHHAIIEGHAADGVIGFAMVFMAIWWAWIGFTWFASAYDPDDVPYRLVVFLQLTGALILAAGVKPMFEGTDLTIVTIGYVVMRLAMVLLWSRAASADPARRTTALRYIFGISGVQALWVALLFTPPSWFLPGFVVLITIELLIPVWAERAEPTTWHPEHIAERFGLLAIIVLGESILAATMAIQAAIERQQITADLLLGLAGGLLILYSAWWLYFAHRQEISLHNSLRHGFFWSYGHYVVFASLAAIGAGLAVMVDHVTGHAEISDAAAGYTVAIPVAIYVICIWFMHELPGGPDRTPKWVAPLVALLVLATPFIGHPVLAMGLLMTAFLVAKLIRKHGRRARPLAP